MEVNHIYMILGVQRSGTNTLRKSLETSGIKSYNESLSNEFFIDWFLKDKESIQKELSKIDFDFIIKPISDTKNRSINDIVNDFSMEGKKVIPIWIYRNPVNVYFSQVVKWGFGVSQFMSDWNKRNRKAINYKKEGNLLHILKYEGLINNKKIFQILIKNCGISAEAVFNKDSNLGEQFFSDKVKNRIRNRTKDILVELDNLAIDEDI